MKIFIAALIWLLPVFSPSIAVTGNPAPLKTGFYKLEEQGKYQLKIKDKIWYTDGVQIGTVTNFKSVNITPLRGKKDSYELNIQLDETGAKSMAKATDFSFDKIYIGLVVDGELKLTGQVAAKILNGSVALSGAPRNELENVKTLLDREMKK